MNENLSVIQNSSIELIFKRFLFIYFRERGRVGGKESEKHRCERETLIICLSRIPNWGRNPQPKHVP